MIKWFHKHFSGLLVMMHSISSSLACFCLKLCSLCLHPNEASGNNITGTKTYGLGQSMHFEASVLYKTESSGNKRLYINKCFMTPSSDPDSNLKYTIVDNQG